MSMTDPIADLLCRVRNGAQARKEYVDCPWSATKERIVRVMIDEGFLKDCSVIEAGEAVVQAIGSAERNLPHC
jgi:small subunit ribosomal protein S8